jgi:hypothetical protein
VFEDMAMIDEFTQLRERNVQHNGLRGANIAAPGPTPTSGFANDGSLREIDAYLLGVLALIGAEAVAFSFENDGRLARNVVVNPLYQGRREFMGS